VAAQTSILVSGYNWDYVVRQTWYSALVPTQYLDFVREGSQEMQGLVDDAGKAGLGKSGGSVPSGDFRVLTGMGVGLASIFFIMFVLEPRF
jgi:hypothetical protein